MSKTNQNCALGEASYRPTHAHRMLAYKNKYFMIKQEIKKFNFKEILVVTEHKGPLLSPKQVQLNPARDH